MHSPDSCNKVYGKPACGMESSHHQLVGVFDVFLKLFNRLPLRHDLRVFKQLPQPKLVALPVDQGKILTHFSASPTLKPYQLKS